MPLYEIFKVVNDDDILLNLVDDDKIEHSRFLEFSVKNEMNKIHFFGKDQTPSIFYPPEENVIEDIFIDALIIRHKFVFLLVCLSGTGLRSLKQKQKYIPNEVVSPIRSYISKKYNIPIKFLQFNYGKDSFSDNIWGENIISKFGYDDENKTYLRVSTSDFKKLVVDYPSIGAFFEDNDIISITAKNMELEFSNSKEKFPGKVKFSIDGRFSCRFADIYHFSRFVEYLINSGKFFKKT